MTIAIVDSACDHHGSIYRFAMGLRNFNALHLDEYFFTQLRLRALLVRREGEYLFKVGHENECVSCKECVVYAPPVNIGIEILLRDVSHIKLQLQRKMYLLMVRLTHAPLERDKILTCRDISGIYFTHTPFGEWTIPTTVQ